MSRCIKHWTIQPLTYISANVLRMITMHAHRRTDRRTDGRTSKMEIARRFVLRNASVLINCTLLSTETSALQLRSAIAGPLGSPMHTILKKLAKREKRARFHPSEREKYFEVASRIRHVRPQHSTPLIDGLSWPCRRTLCFSSALTEMRRCTENHNIFSSASILKQVCPK